MITRQLQLANLGVSVFAVRISTEAPGKPDCTSKRLQTTCFGICA